MCPDSVGGKALFVDAEDRAPTSRPVGAAKVSGPAGRARTVALLAP